MNTIGIFCAGQAGDILVISSVLRYRQEMWGDCKIVWFISPDNMDLLKYQDIELRPFPRGYGYPEMVVTENKKLTDAGKEPIWEDWLPLVDERNHLNLELKTNYPSLAEIDFGFFPAPHQIHYTKRHGLEYSLCSKKVFGIPNSYQWHPFLMFSDEERLAANNFIKSLGAGKIVFSETFAGSGQSLLDEEMVEKGMALCREHWGDCNFIFGSHKFLRHKEKFPDGFFQQPGVFSAADFTVRQCALIAEKSDLFLSVSSGLSVAASAWELRTPPMLQFAGSEICSTKAIANGRFELVTADHKPFEQAKEEFYSALVSLLKTYK